VATLAATGMILSGAYMLWLYRRMIFGVIQKDSLRAILDLSVREIAIFVPLVALAIFFGFYPGPIMKVTAASVDQLLANYQAALSAAGQLALR
jgi:NADH-quinone oxidoreductase subunit M